MNRSSNQQLKQTMLRLAARFERYVYLKISKAMKIILFMLTVYPLVIMGAPIHCSIDTTVAQFKEKNFTTIGEIKIGRFRAPKEDAPFYVFDKTIPATIDGHHIKLATLHLYEDGLTTFFTFLDVSSSNGEVSFYVYFHDKLKPQGHVLVLYENKEGQCPVRVGYKLLYVE
jgi:hypothetical protein